MFSKPLALNSLNKTSNTVETKSNSPQKKTRIWLVAYESFAVDEYDSEESIPKQIQKYLDVFNDYLATSDLSVYQDELIIKTEMRSRIRNHFEHAGNRIIFLSLSVPDLYLEIKKLRDIEMYHTCEEDYRTYHFPMLKLQKGYQFIAADATFLKVFESYSQIKDYWLSHLAAKLEDDVNRSRIILGRGL